MNCSHIKAIIILAIMAACPLLSGAEAKDTITTSTKKSEQVLRRIGSSLPLWERYLDKSKNIRDGAAFIPLAMRMVILQLGVKEYKDLYNLDVQIHLALKEMAFFKGYEEGSRDFSKLINQTARRGDRIEMTIHPDRKTIDIHIYGAIINLDVFDIYLATLDLQGVVRNEGEEMFILKAVIGEKSLIVDKNFGPRTYVEEFVALDSIAFTDIKKENKIKPVFHYQQNCYDLSAAAFYQNGGVEATIYFTGTTIYDDEKSYYYRYLLGLSGSNFIPQLELGTAGGDRDFFYQSSFNMGYNISNNTVLLGLAAEIMVENLTVKLESSFFDSGSEIYDKNDMELTPRFEAGVAYRYRDYFKAGLTAIYQQNDYGLGIGVESTDLLMHELMMYFTGEHNEQLENSSWRIKASFEQLFYGDEDSSGSDPFYRIGLSYNFRVGLPEQTHLNTFARKNLRAFFQ